jgi:NADH-quinone oxidoreductase subunit N
MVLGNLESLRYFLPELVITGTILLLILVHVAGSNRRSPAAALLSLVGTGTALLFAWMTPAGEGMGLFEGMVVLDGFAVFFKVLTALATAIVIFMSIDCAELTERTQAEYYIFLLSVLLGMFLLSSASDIVMVYLALELVSIPSYLLAGYLKGKESSTEASMKYVVYGASASGMMIYGFSLLYGMTGSTQIAEIGSALTMGTPALPGMLAVGPKAAGFAVLVRFFYTVFASPDGADGMWRLSSSVDWPFLFAVLSAVTMTVGNLVAINQKNVKRLLAYSSIAHAGYMLMGFVLLTSVGLKAILFYFIVYLFMNLGAFYVVVLVANGSRDEHISSFSGLGIRAPFAAISLAIFLFALTGIPPFSGFIGKVYLFAEVINQGVYWLALVAAINSVVSLYYYARIIKVMFLETPQHAGELPVAFVPRVMLGIMVVPTLLLGVYWEPAIRVAEASVRLLTN